MWYSVCQEETIMDTNSERNKKLVVAGVVSSAWADTDMPTEEDWINQTEACVKLSKAMTDRGLRDELTKENWEFYKQIAINQWIMWGSR